MNPIELTNSVNDLHAKMQTATYSYGYFSGRKFHLQNSNVSYNELISKLMDLSSQISDFRDKRQVSDNEALFICSRINNTLTLLTNKVAQADAAFSKLNFVLQVMTKISRILGCLFFNRDEKIDALKLHLQTLEHVLLNNQNAVFKEKREKLNLEIQKKDLELIDCLIKKGEAKVTLEKELEKNQPSPKVEEELTQALQTATASVEKVRKEHEALIAALGPSDDPTKNKV